MFVVSVGLGLTFQRRIADLEHRLLREGNSLATDRFERPTHVTPADRGTLGERARPHLRALLLAGAESSGFSPLEHQYLGEALRLQRPISQVPQGWRDLLARNEDALTGFLGATHAEAARGSPEVTKVLRIAGDLAALAVVESLGTEKALTRCVDGLALARDASFGGALSGRMASVGITDRLFLPCVRAIDLAGKEQKKLALVQLRMIRSALPPFASTVKEEFISHSVQTLGGAMSQSCIDALPQSQRSDALRTRAAAQQGEGLARWFSWGLMGHTWGAVTDVLDQIAAAQVLPRAARKARYESLADALASSSNPLTAVAGPTLNYANFDKSDRQQRAQLELLIHAAAIDLYSDGHGSWPESLEALTPELLPAIARDPLSEKPLTYLSSAELDVASLQAGAEKLFLVELTAPRNPPVIEARHED